MFSFANIQALWLLLLLPALLGLFIASRRLRARRLKRFGRRESLSELMPDVSAYKPWIKIAVSLLLVTLAIVMILRPRAAGKAVVEDLKGFEAIVAVDVSNSMLAPSSNRPDAPSRLTTAKRLLEKLLDRLDGNKVGLIVFAGNAYTQVPLTTDIASAKMFIANLSTDMVPTQGTAIGEALHMAMNSFSPNEKMSKAVIVLTDGENFEDDAITAAKEAHKQGIQVDVIGIGDGEGANIPLADGSLLTDESGNVVVTRLDESTAKAIATEGEGVYVSASSSNAVSAVTGNLKSLKKSDLKRRSFDKNAEQFPIFAWIALAVLIISMLITRSKLAWLKNVNFFSSNGSKASK